ncbi:MAG: amino acid deaminase/aldolase, partial [Bacilli bacterium]
QYLKKRAVSEVKTRRGAMLACIASYGMKLTFVNGGGTGSIHTTIREEGVTEITVGSAFYAPTLFDHYKDFKYTPAVYFSLPIVRQPEKDIYTCASGGFIASGAIAHSKQPSPVWPIGSTLLPHEGAGEVQTPVKYRGDVQLNVGESILFRPSKAGEIAERFQTFTVVANNQKHTTWKTYRGEGLCLL